MKKRIMCALLTLIMLVSLVPVSASASGVSISESAITVLKQLQPYSSACTQYGSEYRNGYGTICNRKGEHNAHTDVFNEGIADKALRSKLKELDAAVNSFASATGKSLSQSQHDALVLFSYDCGTSWMSGTGVMRSAVVNGLSGNEFINTMCAFRSDDSDVRRCVEASMYLNGRYSSNNPYNYSKVIFDANGGTMVENSLFYYDSSSSLTIDRIPSKPGYLFMGWYTAPNGGAWNPTLTADNNGNTLFAHWQSKSDPQFSSVSYKMNINQFTSIQPVQYPRNSAPAYGNWIPFGTTVDIVEDFIDSNGDRWCHIKDTGWVKLGAFQGNSASGIECDVMVTVTNSYVRSRKNATIFSAQNGTYNQGDQVRIINTASADGFLWGQVANDDYVAIGWIALMYTNWNDVKDGGNTTSSIAIANAIINCSGYLNVRSEAGTDSSIVGALGNGDKVDIYEIKFVNGHQWGYTGTGWIQLTYAKVTMLTANLDYTTSTDVLNYTFTGVLRANTTAHKDADAASEYVGKELASGTRVAISMLKDNGGEVWGYNGTGWIKKTDIHMDIAKYVVICDSVTVRSDAGAGYSSVEKVVKGVELDISDIKVVDATIWGKTEKYGGWVNLASKYVQRTNAPTINKVESSSATGLIATVINTDSVRVRETSGTFGVKVIGSLSRGTTVAVWQTNKDGDWYKVDSNQDGDYDYKEDGWVSAQYLDVTKGTIGGSDASTGTTGSASGTTTGTAAVETGLGIVANTYTGVNVRTGAGTGNPTVGKILTGTTVEIQEVTTVGASKWGCVTQGWICMDYVTMISNYPVGDAANTNTNTNAGANVGGSTSSTEGNTTTVSTPAVYTGYTLNPVEVQKTADPDALSVRSLDAGATVTIQELVAVTTKITVSSGSVVDGNTTTETNTYTTQTTYWARVNDGWIISPAENIQLNPLEEITYTVTGADEINVRSTAGGSKLTSMKKGTQVSITSLQIVDAKVWGYIEDVGSNGGWVQLDNLSEGALTTQEETQNSTSTDSSNSALGNLVLGSSGNTANAGTNGFVNNSSGYRYTGTVIRTGSVNVRATPSQTGALVTTLKGGAALVIYETTIAESMAWGRCDAGWVYLYYVDLQPCNTAVDAKVVYNENTIAYTDANMSGVAGTYSRMSVVDIYEVVGSMCRTDLGWVHTDNLG